MTTTWIQRGEKALTLPEPEFPFMKDFTYLEEESVLKIPESALPMIVLSSTVSSPFAFGIINIRKSIYNHFMWMHKPGYFASQSWTYREVPIREYLGFDHRLKFWHNPNWTLDNREQIKKTIQHYLDLPKYRTLYDILAIAGQALNKVWIQNPLLRICSDYGSILFESGVDLRYMLKNPAPDQVDKWLQAHSDEYKVFGRYAGE
jgi:hypothetical protein